MASAGRGRPVAGSMVSMFAYASRCGGVACLLSGLGRHCDEKLTAQECEAVERSLVWVREAWDAAIQKCAGCQSVDNMRSGFNPTMIVSLLSVSRGDQSRVYTSHRQLHGTRGPGAALYCIGACKLYVDIREGILQSLAYNLDIMDFLDANSKSLCYLAASIPSPAAKVSEAEVEINTQLHSPSKAAQHHLHCRATLLH